jgi:hypothetical protein
MFVRDWRVPSWLARVIPAALASSIGLAAAAGLFARTSWAPWLGRGSDAGAFLTLAVAVVAAGALRRSRGALPMLSRSLPEARIFRVAVASALGGGALSLWALALGPGAPRALTDAIRHLLAVGVIGAVVVAMTFRLVPALGGRPLPWPALRHVALWALTAAVALRTAQALPWPGGHGPLVVVSGVLVWIALACAATGLMSPAGSSQPSAQ